MSAKPPSSNLKQITSGLLVTFALVIAVTLFVKDYGLFSLQSLGSAFAERDLRKFDHIFKERIDLHTFTNTAHALLAQPWSEAKTNAIKQFQSSLPRIPDCGSPQVYVRKKPDGSKQHLMIFYIAGWTCYKIAVSTPEVTQADMESVDDSLQSKPWRSMATNVYLYRLNM